jgi:hypothetical protein
MFFELTFPYLFWGLEGQESNSKNIDLASSESPVAEKADEKLKEGFADHCRIHKVASIICRPKPRRSALTTVGSLTGN